MLQMTNTEILAPFEIWEVPLENGNTLKFHSPLVLKPFWLPDDPEDPDENEYMAVHVPELFIDSYGETHEELLSAIHSDIRVTWKLIVSKNDERLGLKNMKIKANYLAISEELDNG